VGESLDRGHQLVDPRHRGLEVLHDRTQPGAGRDRAQGGTERVRGKRARERIQRRRRCRGRGQCGGRPVVEPVRREPRRPRVLAVGALERRAARRRGIGPAPGARVLDRRELDAIEAGGGECSSGGVRVGETGRERADARRRGRRGIVQLVGEAGGEPAERDQFLVVQLARGEEARAVDHGVHHERGDVRTLADQRGEMIAVEDQHLAGLVRHRVPRRRHGARKGKLAAHVAGAPGGHASRFPSAIQIGGELSAEHDPHPVLGLTLVRRDLARCARPQLPVPREPFQLRAWRPAQRAVRLEPCQQIAIAHDQNASPTGK
jgi:hypothetical protein